MTTTPSDDLAGPGDLSLSMDGGPDEAPWLGPQWADLMIVPTDTPEDDPQDSIGS